MSDQSKSPKGYTKPGYINISYVVNCARCYTPALDEIVNDRSMKSAAIGFKNRGWRKIDGKWHCPQCVKRIAENDPTLFK